MRMAIPRTGWLPVLTPRRLRQLWYVPVLAVAMALMMLRMLVMARLLDLQGFAEFSGGMLASATFCMLGCVGLQPMLQREWPVQIVRRQERRPVIRALQCHVIALACLVAGLVAAGFGWSPAGLSAPVLAAGLLHGYSQQCFLVDTVESRSRGDAVRFAWQNLARAMLAMAFSVGIALASDSALAALVADALVTLALALAFLARAVRRASLRAAIALRAAVRTLPRSDWRSAATLALTMVLGFVLLNADRWAASERLGADGFAHYSFVWIVLSLAQAVQLLVNSSVYPLVARRYASHGPKAAFRVCMLASAAVLGVGALLALPLVWVTQSIVERWFPRYIDSVVLLPLFVPIAMLRVSDFWSSFLLITGKESRLLQVNVFALVAGLAVWLLATRAWSGMPSTLLQVGSLAVLLTVAAHAGSALVAWQSHR